MVVNEYVSILYLIYIDYYSVTGYDTIPLHQEANLVLVNRFDIDLQLFAVVQMLVYHVHFAFRYAGCWDLSDLLDYPPELFLLNFHINLILLQI